MSQSLTEPTAAFTDAERTDLRRFCGYPAYGTGNSGFQSWRFFQAYGLLEFRLTNLSLTEIQQARLFLAQLYPLEQAILTASGNLDTDQAAVWHHNKSEVRDRMALYLLWRKQLCDFIGVPLGPSMANTGRRII